METSWLLVERLVRGWRILGESVGYQAGGLAVDLAAKDIAGHVEQRFEVSPI